jgi:transposase
MPEKPRYDRQFHDGAVRTVHETDKPIVAVERDLGVNEGTLSNWVTGTGKLARVAVS